MPFNFPYCHCVASYIFWRHYYQEDWKLVDNDTNHFTYLLSIACREWKQILGFARASSHVADFNTRNNLLTQKLLKQGWAALPRGAPGLSAVCECGISWSYSLTIFLGIINFANIFLNFIDDTTIWYLNSKLDLNLSCAKDFRNLNSMLTLVCSNIFSAQFIKIVSQYEKIGYNSNLLQQNACLVVNPITVGKFAFLFNCTLVARTSDSLNTYLFMRRYGPGALAVVRTTGIYLLGLFCSGIQFYVLLSPYLCFISFLYFDLYVFGDDAW